jgi:Tfp pilus assembly protein PilZ
MLREQRRASRHPVDVFWTVRDEQNKQSPRYFSSLNLSEGGIGIEGAREFKPGTPIAIHFEIPETKYAVEGTAKIAWVNPDGHAGIVFNDIPRIARLRLREWLGEKFDKQASSMFPGGEDAGQRTILNLPPSKFEHMVERVMLKHRL